MVETMSVSLHEYAALARDSYFRQFEEMRWRYATMPDKAEDSPGALLVDVRHLTVDNDGDDWPPTGAKEFLGWFDARLRKIPLKYRASARIEIAPEGDYDERSSAEITIWYQRPETLKEIAERRARYAENVALFEKRQRHEAEAERQKYEALKQKFEPPSDSGSDRNGENGAAG